MVVIGIVNIVHGKGNQAYMVVIAFLHKIDAKLCLVFLVSLGIILYHVIWSVTSKLVGGVGVPPREKAY